jgi:hypothetical protein
LFGELRLALCVLHGGGAGFAADCHILRTISVLQPVE